MVKKAKQADEQEKEEQSTITKNKQYESCQEVSTLSLAVPGSILDNAQSPELRTYLAGQIARAICIYKVDEVIVFDDKGEVTDSEKKKVQKLSFFKNKLNKTKF